MELFTIAFSTFCGAAVALAAERLTATYDALRKEEAAINNLILDLAATRALVAPPEGWDWGPHEIQNVTSSVFKVRSLIRDTRLAARPRSHALSHLRVMSSACNSLLSHTEDYDQEKDPPEQLKCALRTFKTQMDHQVEQLGAMRWMRIAYIEPGSDTRSGSR